MTKEKFYTTQLQAGLGMVGETRKLFELWEPGMSSTQLFQIALDSGEFPNVAARRLRNIVAECFAPRLLVSNGYPAIILKQLLPHLSSLEFNQLLFLYTCRANIILADFVREVFWNRYLSGYEAISKEDAVEFVIRATQFGKTAKPWSESTIRRVSGYLPGCCADFGLLDSGVKINRKILSFRIESKVANILAYDLHFSGLGDNSILAHSDWKLFGLERNDVLDELKRLSLKGFLIVQAAGDVTRISWNFKSWEELINVITQG